MKEYVIKEIEIIKNIILQTVPVEQIYLFGSYAYGTPNKDSDLDIYVVLNDNADIRDIDALSMIDFAIFGKTNMSTDILALKKNRFDYRQGTGTLEHTVATRGKRIYG
jgi:predicted nucleotidyltransferase